MKLRRKYIWGIAITFLLLLHGGCIEYDITTRVMPNGNLIRTIIVKGDSAAIFSGAFPVPDDSSWKISTRYESRERKDMEEATIYVYEAEKKFANDKDLNNVFGEDSGVSEHIIIRVDFQKQFKGFVNHYTYAETYSMLFPFHSEPISLYLSEHELDIYLADEEDRRYIPEHDSIAVNPDSTFVTRLSREDSLLFKAQTDSIEKKFQSWQKTNIYDDFYTLVTSSLQKLGLKLETPDNKLAFYKWLDSFEAVESGLEDNQAFINAAASYFKVDPQELEASNPEGFATFNRKFRVAAYSLETYSNRIKMPGWIVSSNASQTSSNTVTWNFKTEDFYAADFTMTVESESLNIGFIAGIASALMLLAGLFIVRRKRN
ncbi:MAG: LPXTG cell wall anchor domain-containing protein [Bacteroidales bacterium]|nr:LPXTG cell wall anchor domain-containing protein [Bacteroidales bacterium]